MKKPWSNLKLFCTGNPENSLTKGIQDDTPNTKATVGNIKTDENGESSGSNSDVFTEKAAHIYTDKDGT